MVSPNLRDAVAGAAPVVSPAKATFVNFLGDQKPVFVCLRQSVDTGRVHHEDEKRQAGSPEGPRQ